MLEEQAGFREGRGMRDQIANIRWIIQRAIEYGKTIYVLHRLQQSVDHSQLWNTLISMRVPEHLIVLIKSLYTKQEAAVKTEYGNTDWFEVRKGR
jgi:hypothetical protein